MNAQVTHICQSVDNHNDYCGSRQPLEFVPGTQLTSDHLNKECLEKRGLDYDWIVANCRSVTAEEASKELGYTAYSDGIMLKGWEKQVQFRPDKAWRSPDDDPKKDPPKYRSSKGHYDVMFPTNPDNPSYWLEFDGIKVQCIAINGLPCIVITEGMFKAIAGCSNGIPTIALLGVEMGLTAKRYHPQGERFLLTWLKLLASIGFGFIIAFDADIATNKDVRRAQKTLCLKLEEHKASVFIASGLWSIEQGKAMDDYIQENGTDKFKREVLEKALPIEAWEKQFPSVNTDGINGKKTGKLPPSSQVGAEIAEDYRDKLLFNNESTKWMRYEADHSGVWSVETDDYIKSIILHALDAKGVIGYSARYVADVVEIVKSHLISRRWIERSPKELLPFKNGVLEVATLKFLSHSPGYKFTWSLPREYNAIANDWSFIDNWLSQATGNDKSVKRILLCYLNAVIKGRSDLEYFLYLTGEGGTGKSTFIRLCASLVGEHNTYSSSLREWESSRFETANAYRKRLLVFPDEPKQPGGIDNLKKATGNDFLKAEEKGKKSFNYVFDGMLIIASNFPIFVSETSSALKRRMIPVPFNNMVPAFMKRNMNKEFEPYLDALINYVLTIPDDEVTKTLGQIGTTSPAVIQQYWEDRKRNDSVLAWVDISLVSDPMNRERTGNDKGDETALYGNYYQCCLRMGMTPKSVNNFVADLKSLLVHTLKWENVKPVKNELFRGLSGVRFRNDRIDSNTPYPIESLCHTQQVDAIEKAYGNTTDATDRPGASTDRLADIPQPLPDKDSDIPDTPNETSRPEKYQQLDAVKYLDKLQVDQKTIPSLSGVSESVPGKGFGMSAGVSVDIPSPVSDVSTGMTDGQSVGHGPVNAVTSDPPATQVEPLKVGDKVWWDNCYSHCAWANPFTITSINGEYAVLDLIKEDDLVPLTDLRRHPS